MMGKRVTSVNREAEIVSPEERLKREKDRYEYGWKYQFE